MKIDLRLGDCIEVLKTIPDNSIDSIVTDPPYGIGFMNKEWDNPQKHQELIDREKKRSEERYAEGKSPAKAGFSTGVQPGLPIGGAKEGKWFQDWCELWARECYRVLKPGGHALSFSAPRTYHRMATAFEDSGFQIRDQIMWVFGSGFPKSHNIGKAIDKKEGNEREVVSVKPNHKKGMDFRYENDNSGWLTNDEIIETKGNSEWEGWGTALKPAHEPIVLARKPLSEKSIVENVLKHGTGGINIDGSRIGMTDTDKEESYRKPGETIREGFVKTEKPEYKPEGRFPANIIFDEEAGKLLDEQSGERGNGWKKNYGKEDYEGLQYSSSTQQCKFGGGYNGKNTYVDSGGASRFFYCPKTSKKDRNEGLDNFEDRPSQLNSGGIGRQISVEKRLETNGQNAPTTKNNHPTVKPTDLMRYLINLVTPKGGTTLDPFMGSGSTGKAAVQCGVNFIGIEKEEEYMKIAEARINHERNKTKQLNLFDGEV